MISVCVLGLKAGTLRCSLWSLTHRADAMPGSFFPTGTPDMLCHRDFPVLFESGCWSKPSIQWWCILSDQFSSVAQSCLTLWPHGLQHTRPPCPSPTPRACSNSSPLSRWCHPTVSFSVTPFSSSLLSFPASGSFPMNWLFASGGRSIEASVSPSVLPMNI